MGPLAVVEREVFDQSERELSHRTVALQVDVLVLEATPEPFHKDVVQRTPTPVHADGFVPATLSTPVKASLVN
jgi:hypothetical protein